MATGAWIDTRPMDPRVRHTSFFAVAVASLHPFSVLQFYIRDFHCATQAAREPATVSGARIAVLSPPVIQASP